MTDKDAAIGRKVMVDELETINQYEAMANHASSDVAKVVRDIADEEKVHVGEAAAIVDGHDKRARPAMEEGVKEAKVIMKSFNEMLTEAIAKSDAGKGYPPMTEAQMMRDPYRHIQMQVNDQVNMNANDGEKISSEGSMKQGEKNDGESGAYDEDHAPAKKEVKDDGASGAFDKSIVNAINGKEVVDGIKKTGIDYDTGYSEGQKLRAVGSKMRREGDPDAELFNNVFAPNAEKKGDKVIRERGGNIGTYTRYKDNGDISDSQQNDIAGNIQSTKKSLPSFADMYSHGVGYAFEKTNGVGNAVVREKVARGVGDIKSAGKAAVDQPGGPGGTGVPHYGEELARQEPYKGTPSEPGDLDRTADMMFEGRLENTNRRQ